MRKVVALIIVVAGLVFTPLTFAAGVECLLHPVALCYDTGEVQATGAGFAHKYHCSCGDDFWVHDRWVR